MKIEGRILCKFTPFVRPARPFPYVHVNTIAPGALPKQNVQSLPFGLLLFPYYGVDDRDDI